MRSVLVILLSLAGLAILGGVVLAALGRGGEMTMFPGDSSPLDLDDVSATDIALLQPPMAFWGYYVPAVEETLQIIARSVADKDAQIAALRQEVDGLRAGHGQQAGPVGPAPGPGEARAGTLEPGEPGEAPGPGEPEEAPGAGEPGEWPEPGEWAEPGEHEDGPVWPVPSQPEEAGAWPVPPRPEGEPPVWPERGAGEWLVRSEPDNSGGPSAPGNDD